MYLNLGKGWSKRPIGGVWAVAAGVGTCLMKDIGINNVERKPLQVDYTLSDSHRNSRTSPHLTEICDVGPLYRTQYKGKLL